MLSASAREPVAAWANAAAGSSAAREQAASATQVRTREREFFMLSPVVPARSWYGLARMVARAHTRRAWFPRRVRDRKTICLLAAEVRGVVGAARAVVDGLLRISAQRTRG